MKIASRLGISGFVLMSALSLGIAFASPALAARGDKAASDEYFQDAKKYLKKGDANAAVIQLKNALQKDRNNVGARRLLGEIYLRLGNGPAAEKELRAALRRSANDIEIQLLVARAYIMQGKYKAILRTLKDEVADDAIRSQILFARGTAFFGLGMRQDAWDSFEEAAKLKPDDANPKLGLAKVLLSRGKYQDAEAQIDAALKLNKQYSEALVLKGEMGRLKNDPEGAMAAFDAALAINKANVSALLGRAATLVDLNKDEAAQADIEAVYRRFPKHPLASFLSALILAKKKDFVGAQELLQQASPALDDHMPSIFLRGAVHYALDHLEQAEDQLSRYVADVPGNVRARKLLGATLIRNNNHAGAIEILKPLLDDNKADAQTLALLGSAYMKTGKFAEGSELFERAVKAAPDVSSIRTQLALSRLVQGSSDQAVGDLQAAIDLDPEARQASILLTLVHLRKSQFDKALEAATRLHETMPENPMAKNLIGAAYLGKENLAKARETFEAALKMKSDFHPARMNLAQLDIKEGKIDRAVRHYERIIADNPKHLGALMAMADVAQERKEPEQAFEWLKKASEANPKAVVPKLRLIHHYVQRRDPARALSVARDLDREVPNNARVLEALGRTEITAGQPTNAVSTFRRLTEIAKDSPHAHHLLGGALLATKNRPAARGSFRRAIELNNSFVPALSALAELESREGNADTALKLAAQISQNQPQSAMGAMLTGDILMRSKKYDKALAFYQEAVEKQDSGGLALRVYNARLALGRKNEALQKLQQWVDQKDDAGVRSALASAYIANGRYDAAIRESEKLLAKNPSNPVILNNLAWLYDQKGDARAIDSAEKALEFAPNSPEVMDTLGWILTRRGELGRAIDLLQTAHRTSPKQGDIAYHLAVALNKSGKTDEARRTLERILSSSVNFSEAANAQKLLKELGG